MTLRLGVCINVATHTSIEAPLMNLTMKGGSQFFVKTPFVIFETMVGRYAYCLGIIKREAINIIGQNFMTGYRIVFDSEEMVLGWRSSDCAIKQVVAASMTPEKK